MFGGSPKAPDGTRSNCARSGVISYQVAWIPADIQYEYVVEIGMLMWCQGATRTPTHSSAT